MARPGQEAPGRGGGEGRRGEVLSEEDEPDDGGGGHGEEDLRAGLVGLLLFELSAAGGLQGRKDFLRHGLRRDDGGGTNSAGDVSQWGGANERRRRKTNVRVDADRGGPRFGRRNEKAHATTTHGRVLG